MTRLFTHNNNGDVAITDSGTVVVDTAIKWEGTDSCRFDSAGAYRERTELTTPGQVQFTRCYIYLAAYPDLTQYVLSELNTAAAIVWRLQMSTTGTLRMVDSGGSFVGSATSALSLNTWYLLEVKWKQDAAVSANGVIAIRLNGVQVLSDTTAPLLTVAANRLRWGRPISVADFTPTGPRFDAVAQNNDQGGADNTYVGGTIPPGVPADLRPSGNERNLACPVGMVNVNNVTLARNNDRLYYRIVNDSTRPLYRLMFGWRMSGVDLDGSGAALTPPRSTELAGSGYGDGDGGTWTFELFAAGTDGKPTGAAIATETGVKPTDRYLTIRTAMGLTLGHMLMYALFDIASWAPGEYVMVARNTHASPNTNFSSVNFPTMSLASAGPHAINNRDRRAAGAIAGLDPREAISWSIDAGAHIYFGQPVGGSTIAHGIVNGEDQTTLSGLYYVGVGDDEIRLPWYGYWNQDGTVEGLQPYYGVNTPVTNQTLTCTNAGRAVTLTHAGAFAMAGGSVGTITVTNLNTGQSRTCTPGGTGGRREAALNAPLDVAAGETITINPSGAVCLEGADAFQTDVDSYGLGAGDFPFTTSGFGAQRLGAYVLPWPYFAAPAATDYGPASPSGSSGALRSFQYGRGLTTEQPLDLPRRLQMTGEQVRSRFIDYSDIAEEEFVGFDDAVEVVLPDLAGTAAGVGAVTGTIVRGRLITGTAAGVGAATGTLRVARQLIGTSAGTGATTGKVTTPKRLSGTAAGTATVTGNLKTTPRLSGAAAAVGTTTGVLRVFRRITGTSAGVGTTSGTLRATPRLAGSAAGVSTATGAISFPVVAPTLSGTTAGVGTTTGTVRVRRLLSGSAAGLGTTTGALRATPRLTGSAVGTSTATGTVRARRLIVGTSAGVGATTGALRTTPRLGGTAAGVSTATGIVRARRLITGTATGLGATTGALRATPRLSGLVVGVSTTTGAVRVNRLITGLSVGTGTATGVLRVARLLIGSATGSATATGVLRATPRLSGMTLSIGLVTGDVTTPSQQLRPDADLDTTGWTVTPLYPKISDQSDATEITAVLA